MVKMTVNEFNKKAVLNFNKKVLDSMEKKLNHYKMLARYTKQSVKLKKHLENMRLWQETIDDYKEEYNLQ